MNGKIAVVTGSTSGIGRAIAEHFVSLGAKVVVHGRNFERGIEVLNQIQAKGGEADFFEADLSIANDCRRLIQFAVEQFGGIDILINNAADTSRSTLEGTSDELWERMMRINLRAPLLCIKECIEPMKRRGGGVIINLGSAEKPGTEPHLFAYSLTKAGLSALTEAAASDLGRHGIRVYEINVSGTPADHSPRPRTQAEESSEWIEKAVLPKSSVTPPDGVSIARLAALLSSSEGAAITDRFFSAAESLE